MTEKWAKKIGFGLLIWGMLVCVSGTADAQVASTTGNLSGGTYNVTAGNLQMARGILTLNGSDIKEGAAQAAQGTAQVGYGALKGVQTGANLNVPILGSLTGHLGDRVAAGAIRTTGDAGARYVAAQEGISQENLGKVSAATGGGFLGTGFGSRNAIAYEVTNSDGSKTKILMDANLNATSGTTEGCIPLPVKLDQMKNCIFCPLFLILYNTSEAMATASFNTLAAGFKTLLLIGFALYISYLTLRQVSAFTKQDAPKYITESLTMAFKVFLAWLLLNNGAELYRLGLEPILSAGIEFGQSFLTHQNTGGTNTDVASCAQVLGTSQTATTFYSRNLYQMVDCYLRKVTQEIAVSQSIGSTLMCVARHKASGLIMWDLTMFTTGLIMWGFAWLICLAFGFYLIDTVVRLGIIGALVPFLIACWPFKITQSYTSTGWKMFLNAFFTFVFLGLVVSVNVELSAQAATGGATVSGDGGTSSGVQAIMDLVNGDKVDELLEIMGIGLSGLIFMLLCCVFGFKLCAEAASLAAQMGTSGGSGIGSKIGSMAAGAAKGAAKSAYKMGKAGAGILGDASGATAAVNEKLEDAYDRVGGAIGAGLAKIGISTPAQRVAARSMAKDATAQNAGGSPKDGNVKPRTFGEGSENDQNNGNENNNVNPDVAAGTSGSTTQDELGRRAQEQAENIRNIHKKPGKDRTAEEWQAMYDQVETSPRYATEQDREKARKKLDDDFDRTANKKAKQDFANNRNVAKSEADNIATSAKADLAQTATMEAEKASRVNSSNSAKSNDEKDRENGDKGNSKDKRAQDQLDAVKLQIAQLQSEITDLRKKLNNPQQAASSPATQQMAERLKKLEEEARRHGINI